MRKNTLARRLALATREMQRREEALHRLLVEPEPFGMVKVPNEEALRRYLRARESGDLLRMRRSMGGPYPDEDVDRWAKRMERLEAKLLPREAARRLIEEATPPPVAEEGGNGQP